MVCGVCNVWGNVYEDRIAHKEKGNTYEKRIAQKEKGNMYEKK